MKDYRRRSRDKDTRSKREESRDRAHRKRDGSTDSRRKARRDDSREKSYMKNSSSGNNEVRAFHIFSLLHFLAKVLTDE